MWRAIRPPINTRQICSSSPLRIAAMSAEAAAATDEDRQLLHDAGWKKIQQNTFTRWVSSHLAKSGEQIEDLVSAGNRVQIIGVVLNRFAFAANRFERWHQTYQGKKNWRDARSLASRKLQAASNLNVVLNPLFTPKSPPSAARRSRRPPHHPALQQTRHTTNTKVGQCAASAQLS